ncbi:guanosine-3',5'-bis(diphosphate) 3'-diphosphatase, (ppGpp)ase [Synechococcus sp. WH 7805]|nr:guanosine-3',5'-bis(diphosphate) 3'-diphosphatase, (ppGpp)ase [Synechococcus sp. WH 7805]
MRWNPANARNGQRFPVQLRIEVIDRVGILKDILMRLSDGSINVSDARVKTTYGKPARIDLRVELAGADLLQRTMDQIRSMADVLDIARTGQG